jgi:hypothetical protein
MTKIDSPINGAFGDFDFTGDEDGVIDTGPEAPIGTEPVGFNDEPPGGIGVDVAPVMGGTDTGDGSATADAGLGATPPGGTGLKSLVGAFVICCVFWGAVPIP